MPRHPFRRATGAKWGPSRLSQYLTINGVTVTATFRYRGQGADATTWEPWGYGEALTENVGGGSSGGQTVGVGTPFTSNDTAVLFNNDAYYGASETDLGEITTEDFVLELVWKQNNNSGSEVLVGHMDGNNEGWRLISVGSSLLLQLRDADASAISISITGLSAGDWYHGIWFVDRSGSGIAYANGVAGSAASVTAIDSGISPGEPLGIGAASQGGGLPCDHTIAYTAMWKMDGWLDTHLQATIAGERFAKLGSF